MAIKKVDAKNIGYTVDTPVPYRLADLLGQIDERMGKLENRSSRVVYHKLMTRIEAVSNDPRYGFMFENANVGGDTMAEALSQLFRVPALGKPLTVLQLAGFPAEVIDAVVSVLCRMAFDFGLWSDGASPGSLPAGLIVRNSGLRCSPLSILTVTASKPTPNSCNVQRTRIEPEGPNS